MVNAWSLAHSILSGTFDEDYPIMTDDNRITPQESDEYDPIGTGNTASIDFGYGVSISGMDGITVSTTDGYEHSDYWYDYTRNDPNATNPFTSTDLTDLEVQANSPYNDGWTQEYYKEELKKMSDLRNKYHEEEILKDIGDYVSRTYNGHYTGTKHEYRNVQTIDLMASRDLASAFCQANILKYGSRYGSKDGKSKTDLMKVIHYAMLLLHFDEHYGKPKFTSGNIDHNMP